MSDGVKLDKEVKAATNVAVEGIVKGNIVTKIIIYSIVTILIIGGMFFWSTIQVDKQQKQANMQLDQLVLLNNNIQHMIQNQAKIDVFRRCIKAAYDNTIESYAESINYFNNDFIRILGKTMEAHNVPFPQELNESIQKFRSNMQRFRDKAEVIKSCLIFPEDLD